MSESRIESAAFERASLESEKLRVKGIVAVFSVLVVVMTLRAFVQHTASPWQWAGVMTFFLIATGLELSMLGAVSRALRSAGRLTDTIWALHTVFETVLPAIGMTLITNDKIDLVYRPLANAAVPLFLLLIALSTLRLQPWICWLSGSSAAVSYLGAAAVLGWRPPAFAAASLSGPDTIVEMFALAFVLAGGAAALVARQIQTHVQAALKEAETRSRLERVQHDLQVARSIQQSLLPQGQPRIDGFDVAGWNQPADDTGGDFFDWTTLPDGRLAICLADVTGHGIGPALLASVCRAYTRSAIDVSPDLPSAITRINRELAADLTPGRFATMVAVVCAPGERAVHILSAGQGPLLCYRAREDRYVEIDSHTMPLGILPELPPLTADRLDLDRGDILILATDGFYEWEDASGDAFGDARAKDAIRHARDLTADRIIASLYGAVKSFSGGTAQKDDLTAVVIKRT